MYTIWSQIIPPPGGEPSVIAHRNVVIAGRQSFQFVIQDETHIIKVVPSSASTPHHL